MIPALPGVIFSVAPGETYSLLSSSCSCSFSSVLVESPRGVMEKRYPLTLISVISSLSEIWPNTSRDGASDPDSYRPIIWRDFPMDFPSACWLIPAFSRAPRSSSPRACFQDGKLLLASTCAFSSEK